MIVLNHMQQKEDIVDYIDIIVYNKILNETKRRENMECLISELIKDDIDIEGVSEDEIVSALEIVGRDLVYNNFIFGKDVTYKEFLERLNIYVDIIKKCKMAAHQK